MLKLEEYFLAVGFCSFIQRLLSASDSGSLTSTVDSLLCEDKK